MRIELKKTAEIALRSLGTSEQRQTAKSLRALHSLDIAAFFKARQIQRLGTYSEEKLYSYRINPKLRIVFSVHGDKLIVEDIVNHDRLERMLSHREKP